MYATNWSGTCYFICIRDEKLFSKLQTLGFSGLYMTLEFEEADKSARRAHEILKLNLLFLMAEHKPENLTQIIIV
jgi:hypothetical protein